LTHRARAPLLLTSIPLLVVACNAILGIPDQTLAPDGGSADGGSVETGNEAAGPTDGGVPDADAGDAEGGGDATSEASDSGVDASDAGCTTLALHFTASDGVRIPDVPIFAIGATGTYEAWILLDVIDAGAPGGSIVNKWVNAAEDKHLYLAKSSGDLGGQLYPSGTFTATSPEVRAQWSHVALTYDATGERLYADGVQVAQAGAVTPANNTGAVWIGASPRPLSAVLGFISEVRVSNVARYTASFTPAPHLATDAQTVAFWKLDEGTGTTANDSSGNGNPGTLDGGAWLPAPCR
jgi:hypothetical protein